MAKNAGLRIRVEPELREAFLIACKEQDQTAAQVLRSFMRDVVDRHQRAKQHTLFPDEPVIHPPTKDRRFRPLK